MSAHVRTYSALLFRKKVLYNTVQSGIALGRRSLATPFQASTHFYPSYLPSSAPRPVALTCTGILFTPRRHFWPLLSTHGKSAYLAMCRTKH